MATSQVRYVGIHDEIDVRIPDEPGEPEARWVRARRGAPITVDADLAKSLVESAAWEAVTTKKETGGDGGGRARPS